MKTPKDVLHENFAAAGSLRVLIGSAYSGKRAIYISGTPDGLRLLADLLQAQADAPPNHFSKLQRDAGDLFFTTDDSVDVFEIHCAGQHPQKHETRLEERERRPPEC